MALASPSLLARFALPLFCLLGGCSSGEHDEEARPGDREPAPIEPYARPEYTTLSETGLYADLEARRVAAGVASFTPNFVLWADDAEKRRYVALPPGVPIDTDTLDHWVFPVGTKFWKEFLLDGQPIETRLVERYGDGPSDYFMGAFVWRADGSDAELAPDGLDDAGGTVHDVPSQKQCQACHNGERGRILGFSAFQLARAATGGEEWTLGELTRTQRLSDPPASDADYAPPGDATTAAAFGYLHANCGHCHNESGTAWPDTQLVLRLDLGETEGPAEATGMYRTLVGKKLQYYRDPELDYRVVPGEPDASALVVRMARRGGDQQQMPPLGTEVPDAHGLELVRNWIAHLPPGAE